MPVIFPTREGQPELPGEWDNTEIEGIIEGAVDLHVHPFPSPFPRRMGILEAADDAAAAKYRAIVVKSHHHSMVPDVLALNEAGLGESPVKVFGGVALNPQVGGLNPYAVDLALNLGGRIVWFPTISSHAHLECEEDGTIASFPNATVKLRHAHPISVLGEDGRLKAEVYDILEQIKDHDAILTGGHLPANEIEVLFDAALAMGLERILVNHPNFVVGATPEQVGGWARKGIYVEHSVGMYDTFFGLRPTAWGIEILLEYIKHTGVGRTLLVSDTGQQKSPRPGDVIKVAIRNLLSQGIKDTDVQRMVGGNAGDLILG